MTTIAERVKDIRIEKRMTQAEFGEKLGISKQAIANVEAGNNNPSIVFIIKLIEDFHVNANWLLAGIGDPFIPQLDDQNDAVTLKVEELLKKHGLI